MMKLLASFEMCRSVDFVVLNCDYHENHLPMSHGDVLESVKNFF